MQSFGFILDQKICYMREVINYEFCTLCLICPRSAVNWNRQNYNRPAKQQVKHLVTWGWSVLKCSDIKVIFQTAIFIF